MSIDTFLLSADTTDLNYPEVRPTLDLNFARVKALDPRITFTRASGGSYVGADGYIKFAGVNEARFDHDPVTGECLGLLVEESRTNLVTYSEQFNDASWTKLNSSITANTIIAPDGTLTADKLVENTATDTHRFFKNTSGTTNTLPYVYSVFVKAAERPRVYLGVVEGTTFSRQGQATFDLTTGTVISSNSGQNGASVGVATITNVGNGWYRCAYSVVLGGTDTTVFTDVIITTASGQNIYAGDGTSGLFVWGAQLEAGAFPTSYIPTVASTRTRASDNARITGKNFSEWYRQDEGTVYSQFKTQLNIVNNIWSINNYPNTTFGTLQNYFRLLTLSNNIHTQYNVAGTNLYPIFPLTTNNSQKVTQSYNINPSPITSALNGTIGTGSGNIYATSPGFNQLEFGKNTDARTTIGQYTIARLTYYPKRLPDAQLQALTR